MEKVFLRIAGKVFVLLAPYIRKVTGPVYRLSGPLAGLSFIGVVVLSPSVAERFFDMRVPIVPPASDMILYAFMSVSVLFFIFASVETIAGLITWLADFVTPDDQSSEPTE